MKSKITKIKLQRWIQRFQQGALCMQGKPKIKEWASPYSFFSVGALLSSIFKRTQKQVGQEWPNFFSLQVFIWTVRTHDLQFRLKYSTRKAKVLKQHKIQSTSVMNQCIFPQNKTFSLLNTRYAFFQVLCSGAWVEKS